MKTQKKVPSKQLEKYSTVFTQLGLVLTLFIVYLLLEHQTEDKSIAYKPDPVNKTYVFNKYTPVFKVEEVKKKVPLPKEPNIITDLSKVKKVNNDHKTVETIVDLPIKKEVLNIDTLVVVDEGSDIEKDDDPVNFSILEEAPIFRGCEGLTKEENRRCFESKMARFVQKHFNGDLAGELGLSSGKYRISTQFVIDKKGDIVDLQIRAPHTKLKKETQRIVRKIPKFTPGKQQGKEVKVRYTLPITFQVQ